METAAGVGAATTLTSRRCGPRSTARAAGVRHRRAAHGAGHDDRPGRALPVAGEPHVVMAWQRGAEGRKHLSASALCAADGTVLAMPSPPGSPSTPPVRPDPQEATP